jgi:hypothetical protein
MLSALLALCLLCCLECRAEAAPKVSTAVRSQVRVLPGGSEGPPVAQRLRAGGGGVVPGDARQALRVLCPRAVGLAPLFEREAARHGLPAVTLIAMARNESRCQADARGAHDERGIMQVKPGTRAAGRVPLAHLDRPAVNIRLGAAHLARCLLLCGDLAGALGVYSGRKTCKAGRASGYARRVLELVEKAKGERS